MPSRTSEGRSLPLDRWKNVVLAMVLPLSGGATEIPAIGHWLDRERHLVTEPVCLIDVYVSRRLSSSKCRHLVSDLLGLARRMRQEALAVVVGERLHLVQPEYPSEVTPDTTSRRSLLRQAAMRNGHARRIRSVA